MRVTGCDPRLHIVEYELEARGRDFIKAVFALLAFAAGLIVAGFVGLLLFYLLPTLFFGPAPKGRIWITYYITAILITAVVFFLPARYFAALEARVAFRLRRDKSLRQRRLARFARPCGGRKPRSAWRRLELEAALRGPSEVAHATLLALPRGAVTLLTRAGTVMISYRSGEVRFEPLDVVRDWLHIAELPQSDQSRRDIQETLFDDLTELYITQNPRLSLRQKLAYLGRWIIWCLVTVPLFYGGLLFRLLFVSLPLITLAWLLLQPSLWSKLCAAVVWGFVLLGWCVRRAQSRIVLFPGGVLVCKIGLLNARVRATRVDAQNAALVIYPPGIAAISFGETRTRLRSFAVPPAGLLTAWLSTAPPPSDDQLQAYLGDNAVLTRPT